MEKLNIKIIIGSIRESRFGEHATKWFYEIISKDNELDVEILDLKDFDLPIFNSKTSPAYVEGSYGNPKIDKWADKIREADGFIIVTPEYNHGYSSALKNAIDHLYKEWNHKAVAFVAYGSQGGARAVEQLRQVAVEIQMASTRNALHINSPWFLVNENNELKEGVLDEYNNGALKIINELKWWSEALKNARSKNNIQI